MNASVGIMAACSVLLVVAVVVDATLAARHRRVVARFDPEVSSGRWAFAALVGPLGPVPAPVDRVLARAGWGGRGAVWWPRWLLAVVMVPTATAVAVGPAAAAAALVLLTAVPLVVLRSRGARDRHLLEAALPDLVDDVARSIRGGCSLPQAITAAAEHRHGPWQPDLLAVASGLDHGATLSQELKRWGSTSRCEGFGLVVAALALGSEAGGAQARALDGVAATLRSRAAARDEVRALSSQARASALVMALTPAAFAGLAAITDRRTADFLLRDPAGVGCLLAGTMLDLVALLWMMRITGGGRTAS